MPKDKRERASDQELDSIGRLLVKAASMSDQEADAAVAAPFAFQRVRSRIEAERALMEAPGFPWLAMIAAARKAIPAMGLIAAVAIWLSWFSAKNPPAQPLNEVAGLSQSGFESVTPVTACSISSRSECVVSIDEVLAMMIDRNDKEFRK